MFWCTPVGLFFGLKWAPNFINKHMNKMTEQYKLLKTYPYLNTLPLPPNLCVSFSFSLIPTHFLFHSQTHLHAFTQTPVSTFTCSYHIQFILLLFVGGGDGDEGSLCCLRNRNMLHIYTQEYDLNKLLATEC